MNARSGLAQWASTASRPGRPTLRSLQRQRGISLILVSVLLLLVVATASLVHAAWSLDLREQSRRVEQNQLARRVAASALAYGMEYVRAGEHAAGPGTMWMACPSHADEAPCAADFGTLASTSLQVLAVVRDDGTLDPWLLGDEDGRVESPPWSRSGRSTLSWRVALLRCADAASGDPRCTPRDRRLADAPMLLLAEVRAPASEIVLARRSAALAPFPLVADGADLPALWTDRALDLRGSLRIAGAIDDDDPVIVADAWIDASGRENALQVCAGASPPLQTSCGTCICPRAGALATALEAKGRDAGSDVAAALFGIDDGTLADFGSEYARPLADCAELSADSVGLIVAPSPCFITAEAVGGVDNPLVLLVDGDVSLGPDVVFHGLLVLHGGGEVRLAARSGARIEGAVMATGDLQVAGDLDVIRQADLRTALRTAPGFAAWGWLSGSRRQGGLAP